jgi:AcrR family transcriptional regulator
MTRRTPEQTRQEILDEAAAFLSSHSFRDLTVATLMARTAVGRSSFYHHFNSVHDLAGELLSRVRSELADAGAGAFFSGTGDIHDELEASLKAAVGVWIQRGPMLRAIAEAAPLDPQLEIQWTEFSAIAARAMAQRITEEQHGHVPTGIDVSELAHAVNLLVISYLNDRLGGTSRADPDLALRTLDFLIRGPGFGSVS